MVISLASSLAENNIAITKIVFIQDNQVTRNELCDLFLSEKEKKLFDGIEELTELAHSGELDAMEDFNPVAKELMEVYWGRYIAKIVWAKPGNNRNFSRVLENYFIGYSLEELQRVAVNFAAECEDKYNNLI